MNPTGILKNEHRVIETVLGCLEKLAGAFEYGNEGHYEDASDVIYFLRTFADRCHHGKEEDLLFPMMERRGYSPERGPTAVMRSEHVLGRNAVSGMESALQEMRNGNTGACGGFKQHALSFVSLLREHIRKEDHCLFPMADNALSAEEQKELALAFQRVEKEIPGHEKCTAIAARLAAEYGIDSAAAQGHSGTLTPMSQCFHGEA